MKPRVFYPKVSYADLPDMSYEVHQNVWGEMTVRFSTLEEAEAAASVLWEFNIPHWWNRYATPTPRAPKIANPMQPCGRHREMEVCTCGT